MRIADQLVDNYERQRGNSEQPPDDELDSPVASVIESDKMISGAVIPVGSRFCIECKEKPL